MMRTALRPLLHRHLARTTPHLTRPLFSRTPAEWIDYETAAPPVIRRDELLPYFAEALLRTLPTRQSRVAGGSEQSNELLPKAHHLVYFKPDEWLDNLTDDGLSQEYRAPEEFPKRLWGAGTFHWSRDHALKLGDDAVMSVKVSNAEQKGTRMYVQQERMYFASNEAFEAEQWAVKEERTIVFLPDEPTGKSKNPIKGSDMPDPDEDYTVTFTPSTVLLFRYSALTYNGHKIHYDQRWAKEKEGYDDVIVHGPLTATILTELASRVADNEGKLLTKLEYRATSPLYVDKEIKVCVGWENGVRGDTVTVWAEQDGVVGMKGKASLVDPRA